MPPRPARAHLTVQQPGSRPDSAKTATWDNPAFQGSKGADVETGAGQGGPPRMSKRTKVRRHGDGGVGSRSC